MKKFLLLFVSISLGVIGVQSSIGASFSDTGTLVTSRSSHTATLLPNGKVLVTGGLNNTSGTTVLTSAELYDPATGTWSTTGSLATARYGHTATLLLDGKVLVTGGSSFVVWLASAELYDPNPLPPGTWSPTGDLPLSRSEHTATLLANGKVLVAGGTSFSTGILRSALLYDPATQSWSATGNLVQDRQGHTAILLLTGKVLVVAGEPQAESLSAEIYDPDTATWSATGSLATGRFDNTATLLLNGKVLVAGGRNRSPLALATVEIYDPETGIWTGTGNLATARYGQTATLLPSGKVLVAGGTNLYSFGSVFSSAEVYDPGTGKWSATGNLGTARFKHTATSLPNGKVLVVGGTNTLSSSGSVFSSAEVYDPVTGVWSSAGSLVSARKGHTATLLSSGKVLVTGGKDAGGDLTSSEIYDPATGTWNTTDKLATGRSGHTATLLPNGKVMATGGTHNGYTLPSAELYNPVKLQNLSTRLNVLIGDNVLIGGFIIAGSDFKKVMLRAMAPSLPLAGVLGDPVLELHFPGGDIVTNDNWKINDLTGQSQESEIRSTTIPPPRDFESAIVQTLAPGAYTALVRGKNNGKGVGLVEVYDLDQISPSKMANISTRGFVDSGNNVMIGGFILGPGGSGDGKVLLRAMGPSLPVPGALSDPTLELHDGNGTLIVSNDNWKTNDATGQSQEAIIRDTTIPPSNDLESAILTTLAPGNYTAIVAGKNGGTGVGLVEVYNLP